MREFMTPVSPRSVSVVAASLAVVLVAGLTGLFFRGQLPLAPLVFVIALPWLAVVLSADSRRISLGLVPIGIPVLVLALPFVHLIFSWVYWEALFQTGSVALAAFYLRALGPAARRQALARAYPTAVPLLVVFGLFVLSYALSPGGLTRSGLLVVFNLLLASAYVVLAGVFCSSLQNLRRGIVLLIGVGALQLPIVFAQATSLADRLPVSLRLGTANWTGPLLGRLGAGPGGVLARYPGSIGDYELLAEFSTLCFLLCLGLIVFRLHRGRPLALYVLAGCVAAVGWLTGTRSFVFGVVGGSLLLVILALLQPGRRLARVWRVLLVIGLVVIALAVLVPSSVTSAYLDRFLKTNELFSGDVFNRYKLYANGWSLVGEMPTLGYGANMRTVFQQSWGQLVDWPHSLYMTTLLTAGFLGLVALAWLVVGLVAMPVSCTFRRRWAQTDVRALAGILAVVIVVWVLNEAKIEFLRSSFYVDLMAFLFGLISSLFWLSRNPKKRQRSANLRGGPSIDTTGA